MRRLVSFLFVAMAMGVMANEDFGSDNPFLESDEAAENEMRAERYRLEREAASTNDVIPHLPSITLMETAGSVSVTPSAATVNTAKVAVPVTIAAAAKATSTATVTASSSSTTVTSAAAAAAKKGSSAAPFMPGDERLPPSPPPIPSADSLEVPVAVDTLKMASESVFGERATPQEAADLLAEVSRAVQSATDRRIHGSHHRFRESLKHRTTKLGRGYGQIGGRHPHSKKAKHHKRKHSTEDEEEESDAPRFSEVKTERSLLEDAKARAAKLLAADRQKNEA